MQPNRPRETHSNDMLEMMGKWPHLLADQSVVNNDLADHSLL